MKAPRLSSCPAHEDLERLAVGGSTDEAVQRHVDGCADCQSAIQQILEDNALIKEYGASHGIIDSRSMSETHPRIKGYEIRSEIYRGGQGVVYHAVQLSTKRVVAIKVLAPRAGVDSRHRRRFEREIEVVGQLRHPNIVTLFDSGTTTTGHHYLIMEYVQGARLDQYLSGATALSVESTLRLFSTICSAIQFAHRLGVMHRDLKPANILVDHDHSPHILDFGLAKAIGPDYSVDSYTVTRGNEFVGTLAYASPEQLCGNPERVDSRTDVYSLGVVLYEMLTRTLPYPVDGALSSVVHTITEVEPTRPSLHREDIGGDLETIILKALSKDPQRRYQSVESLQRDILHFLAGDPIDARRDSTWYVLGKMLRRHQRAAVFATIFVIVLVAFAATMFVQSRQLSAERDQLRRANRSLRLGEARQALSAGNYPLAEEGFWRVYLGDLKTPHMGPSGLDATPGPIDAYWGLWEYYSHQPCLRTWHADSGHIICAASTDGKTLLTLDTMGRLSAWDIESGARIDTTKIPGVAEPKCMTVLPSGHSMVLGDASGSVHIWNLDTHQTEAERKVDDCLLTSLDINPAGTAMLVSGIKMGTHVLSLPGLDDRGEIVDSGGPACDARFAPNGESVASVDAQCAITIRVWPQLKQYSRLPPSSSQGSSIVPPKLRFRPDGNELAVGYGRQITLVSPESGANASHIVDTRLSDIGYDPAGNSLVSFDANGLKLFSLGSFLPGDARQFHNRQLSSFAFVPQKRLVAASDLDGIVRLWELEHGAGWRTVPSSLHTVHCLSFNKDGRLMAISGGPTDTLPLPEDLENPIRIWDLQSDAPIFEVDGHTLVVSCVAFDPSGSRLASGDYGKLIRVWDIASSKPLISIPAHDAVISMIAYSPDGKYLASGADDSKVKLWNASTGELIHEFAHPGGRVPCVCFSPDGTLLASCNVAGANSNTIILTEISTRRTFELFRSLDGGIRALCFSPDGRILASGSDNHRIRLWNIRTRSCFAEWESPPHEIFSLSYHPAGRILASAGRDSEITLWDTANPSAPYLATLHGNNEMVFSVQFHPDGRHLASGGSRGNIRVWDLAHYDRHIRGNQMFQTERLHDIPLAN